MVVKISFILLVLVYMCKPAWLLLIISLSCFIFLFHHNSAVAKFLLLFILLWISSMMHTGITGSVSGLWTSHILHGPRWSRLCWSSPGLCPSSTHTILLSPLYPQPSGRSFCCLQGTPDDSALVCPPVTQQQSESFTGLSQSTQYLSHLKFKHWAQAVELASLSRILIEDLTMSTEMGFTLWMYLKLV